MNVLLDECIPRKLKYAETAGFDLFVTMDKGLQYQQTLVGRSLAILIIRAKSNRLVDLLPHVETCLAVMRSIQPGQAICVGEQIL